MIQPIVNIEAVAYLGESVRIDASKSLTNGDALVSMKITPEVGSDPIDCMTSGYIDYVYETVGAKTITVDVNGTSKDFTDVVDVIDPSDLNLFSEDSDLVPFEPDVFKYLPDGWSKFTRIHKRAQATILDSLDERGIVKTDSSGAVTRYDASDIYDKEEVRSWSAFLVLAYLFEGMIVDPDDIFSKKALKYLNSAEVKSSRASVRLKPQTSDQTVPEYAPLSYSRLGRG